VRDPYPTEWDICKHWLGSDPEGTGWTEPGRVARIGTPKARGTGDVMAGKTPQRPSSKKPATKSIKEKRQVKQQKKQQKRGIGG
jgi:hypothetical protein